MGSPAYAAILKELQALHDEKDAAYSGDSPLSNYRTAEEWGDPAWKSSLLRAEEKRKRLQNQWLAGKPLRRDDWLDWIGHLINTLVLWEEVRIAPKEMPLNPCGHEDCHWQFVHACRFNCEGSGWKCRNCGYVC